MKRTPIKDGPVIDVVPCTLREACAFVAAKHRHHHPPQGGLFAVGAAVNDVVVGVVIVGRPLRRACT